MNILISFKFGKTVLRIHFSFLLFNALVFLLRDSRLILAFYTVCALHEGGHLAALALMGGHIRSVEMEGTGIRIDTPANSADPVKKEVFVLISGPAVNIIMYIITVLTGRSGYFAMLNLGAAVYNLLPYRRLDGGGIIAQFTSGAVHEKAAELVLNVLKLCITGTAAAFVIICGSEFLPLLTAAAFLYISDYISR